MTAPWPSSVVPASAPMFEICDRRRAKTQSTYGAVAGQEKDDVIFDLDGVVRETSEQRGS